MSQVNVPRWTGPDNFSVAAHQRLVDKANGLSNVELNGPRSVYRTPFGITLEDGEGPIFDEVRQGIVTDAGPNDEADFTDNQYWIKIAKITPGSEGTTVDAEIDEPPIATGSITQEPSIIPATNRFERRVSSHQIPVDEGTWVEVYGYIDDDGNRRWIFYEATQAWFICIAVEDGGSVGSPTATCDLTYSLNDLYTGLPIPNAALLTPYWARFPNCEYISGDGTPAIGYYAIGGINLFAVSGERPKGDLVEVVVGEPEWVEPNFVFHKKNILVLESEDISDTEVPFVPCIPP